MIITKSLWLALVSSAVVAIGQARADEIQPCTPPSGVVQRLFPNDLPRALKEAIQKQFGEVVAPGEKFDATDVVMTGKSRRAIFVWQRGARWVIATEHGGRGYNNPVLAFEVSLDGSTATFIKQVIASGSICATARELIDAK